ncbi:hypothetical protein ADEAN_000761300 [Angomonas deanei]|uniref:Uncharacterized protein n=1 Tax=Angomonas deanei TaxID=59799 RepID=A0A7G2CJQ6_9TRYP|nr:hypothetical protein ADEAN_000761300 [Angomonas deanei]
MSEAKIDAKAIGAMLNRLLLEGNTSPATTKGAFLQLFQAIWCEHQFDDAQSAALATSLCLPIWEYINIITCWNTVSTGNATLLQMLTSLYSKPKDRRCFYQQINALGGGSQPGVPLATPTSGQEIVAVEKGYTPSEYTEVLLSCSNFFGMESRCSTDSGWLRNTIAKVNTLLPRVVLVGDEEPKSDGTEFFVHLRQPLSCITSFSFLASAVWKILHLAVTFDVDVKEMKNTLLSSAWSAQTVSYLNSVITYRQLFGNVVDTFTFCAATGPKKISTASDNLPPMSPSILRRFLSEQGCTMPTTQIASGNYNNLPIHDKIQSNYESLRILTREKIEETIPQEMSFSGESSLCRSGIQLTLLLRETLSSQATGSMANDKNASAFVSKLIFSRKRSRNCLSFREGPSLVPAPPTFIFSNSTNSTENSSIERICVELSCDQNKTE